jgi:hypothetical protein
MGFWKRLFGKKSVAAAPVQPARVTPAAPAKQPSGAASLVRSKLIQSLSDPDARTRIKAAMELGRTPGEESLQALLGALKHPDPQLRERAGDSLRILRDPRAVRGLIQVLESDTEHAPCYAAINALAAFRTPEAIQALLSALKARKGDLGTLAFHLGELKVSQAGEPLIELLRNDSTEARRHAVMSLHKLNYRRAIPSLQKALNDEDAGVRERAQQALRFFGENAVAPFSYINGWIVYYPDLEQAQKDFCWLVENLAPTVPGADFDVGVAKMEDKDRYVVIVTSDYPNFWKVFREKLYPQLSGKDRDLDGNDLQGSDERTLPGYLGEGGKLLMHRHVSHAASANA